MNDSATNGTIQPVVRRVASSSKMMKMTPSTTSSLCRHGRAVGEFLPAFDGVNEDRRAQHTGGDVPPADAIAEPLRQREQKEAQYQHEGDVRAAQRLGGDDGEVGEWPRARDGRVKVKQRHRDRDRRDQSAGPADQAIDHALLSLDVGLRLLQLLLGNGRRSCPAPAAVFGHIAACCALHSRRHASPAGALPSAACAAARRAMGTRNGEHET